MERDKLQRNRLDELKREIKVGLEQLDAGRSIVFDGKTLQGIKQRGRERLAQPDTEGWVP
jgi:hypothetical protein